MENLEVVLIGINTQNLGIVKYKGNALWDQ